MKPGRSATLAGSALVLAIAAGGGAQQQQTLYKPIKERIYGADAAAAVADPTRPKNEYNISLNYELGMHCTGFDFTYCCVLPPYNSVQAQVIKTAVGAKKWPEVLESDEEEHGILVDGKKRMKIKFGHTDNTYSEGDKLAYWDVKYDVNGDGQYTENENVANAYFTHLYVYKDLKGSNPDGTSADSKKARVGIEIPIPKDNGPAGAAVPSPMSGGHLHYSGVKGTTVFTKSPVLDNVPIVLTNPGIWDALGLALTPWQDSIMKRDPLNMLESEIRPFQESWAALVDAESGEAIIDSVNGKPVHFIGTSPIDIPNCANCHSNKNANGDKYNLWKVEKAFWKALGASEWIANLKGTSLSILEMHDDKHGTDFLKNYDPGSRSKDNRMGGDPILCQKCHADNVIGVLQSKKVSDIIPGGEDRIIMPLTEAIHLVHQEKRPLPDSQGRTGSCQGCHPSHRQDGNMDRYPITENGENLFANADNRDGEGCFAGRDVHSNPYKDKDGAGTPEHLNAIGSWIQANVSNIGNGEGGKGLWCTNCHSPLARALYQADNLTHAFRQEGATLRDKSLEEIAAGIGVDMATLESMMDPKVVLDADGNDTPGKSQILALWDPEIAHPDIAVIAIKDGGPMGSRDEDGDFSVIPLSANPAVDVASLTLPEGADGAMAVPYNAATHGKSYWLSAGEPHCADCHAAPYVEGQGGVAFPINQPGKYSLMRYTKGHAGLACQVCHESTHGLYPVTADVDITTYKQAAQFNPDGSHGPMVCAACHYTNETGVPLIANKEVWEGKPIMDDFDAAVSWMHATAPDLGGAIPDE
ncbi:MAG: hypothetical protein H8D24_08165 [Gammaproteobacteria bacterium]|uniref:Cytochrome c domain-containing protein n=1 Tax=Candidatus Thiopontia autotrophica TaxID=2841688 RepID=A0A8J6NYZ4_9GAMM|nr:hypothetical protein [Candidatus Thiopontia autotrophica]